MTHPIFVFGSNTAGRHGKGSANYAWKVHGASYGVGEGHTGRAYAIPTKDDKLRSRSLAEIEASVDRFIAYSIEHPELEFFVVKVGCGLAGFTEDQIAPMFLLAGDNVILPDGW